MTDKRCAEARSCATIGCKVTPSEILVWRESRAEEAICGPCALSYSRRPQYGRTYFLKGGQK